MRATTLRRGILLAMLLLALPVTAFAAGSAPEGGDDRGPGRGHDLLQAKVPVGRFAAVNDTLSGTHVRFGVDLDHGSLLNYSLRGKLLFSRVDLGGGASWRLERGVSEVRLVSLHALVEVHDTRTGNLRLRFQDAGNLTFVLAPGVEATGSHARGAALRAGNQTGVLLLGGAGGFSASNGTLRFTVQEGSEVIFRGSPWSDAREVSAPEVAAEAKVAAAVALGRVGGEVHVASADASALSDVVGYGPVRTHVVSASPASGLVLQVDSERPEGKSFVIHLDRAFLNVTDPFRVRVLMDGIPGRATTNLSEALNASTAGGSAKYHVLLGASGLQVVVGVGHFSAHTLQVQSFEPAGTTPTGRSEPRVSPPPAVAPSSGAGLFVLAGMLAVLTVGALVWTAVKVGLRGRR